MTEFLGPRAFAGTYTLPSCPFTKGGQATYEGNIVFTNLAKKHVVSVLPPDILELAPSDSDVHPVLCMIGHLRNTSWVINDRPVFTGDNYDEMILLVPFVVRKRGGTLWHNYVVRMYLDHTTAIWIGNEYYAYNKTWGIFDWDQSPRVFASTRDGTRKFEAKLEIPDGFAWEPSKDAEASLPNYKEIKAILSMPMLGATSNTASSATSSGQPLCSYFELDYTWAQVVPITSTHKFVSEFVPGMKDWVALGSLSSVENGAVRVRSLEWRLQQPPLPGCQF
jgi:hypothetical protein